MVQQHETKTKKREEPVPIELFVAQCLTPLKLVFRIEITNSYIPGNLVIPTSENP